MTDQDLRVRQLAYRIWESEGRPSGQEQRHWDMALKIVNAEQASGNDESSADSPAAEAPGADDPGGDAAPEASLGEENAPMDDRGASDYAQPEPPTAPAQAPVSPGAKGSDVVAKAEKKAKAAVSKATKTTKAAGAKATKPKAKATKSKTDTETGTASRAKKTPKASPRKPKGSAE